MNEDRINELKDALRILVELIAQRGEPLFDDLRALLVQAMEHVATRIQELRAEQVPPTPIPELEPGPYPSSNINAFQFNPKTKELIVKFQDKYPGQNGPIYSYAGVPDFIFDVFRRGAVGPKTSGKNAWHRWKKGVTPSLGAAMNALIKNGGFSYRRLN